jgi:hypothetical protein
MGKKCNRDRGGCLLVVRKQGADIVNNLLLEWRGLFQQDLLSTSNASRLILIPKHSTEFYQILG